MEFIKEWWFIIAFTISALVGFYKMGKVLNETLLKLNLKSCVCLIACQSPKATG